MRTTTFGLTFLALAVLVSGTACGAYIPSFAKTTNDGVFTITPGQASFLGVPTADRVGFFRVREAGGTILNPGDFFDPNSILNSTNNDSKILGIFNGENAGLTYTGDFYEPLGITTIGASDSYFRGVMFAFESSAGNIVFGGTSTFNGGQTQGSIVIPEPASCALLCISALGVFGLRRRAA